MSIAPYIKEIGRGKEGARSLDQAQAYDLMSQVLDGRVTDLEIGAFNQIPTTRKKLHVIPHTTHMKLYSDQAKLKDAASLARDWFAETL